MTRKYKSVALAIAGVLLLPNCAATNTATAKAKAPPAAKVAADAPVESWAIKSVESGKASFYSIRSNRGTRTASGQVLCDKSATAAHKTLPMGTKVRVINLANGKSEVVTINNRGPFIKGRIIDVTVGVADRLGFVSRGVIPVKVEVLDKPKPNS